MLHKYFIRAYLYMFTLPKTEHMLILPMSIQISKKTRFPLNLNGYKNAHHRLLTKAKKLFIESIQDQVIMLPNLIGPIALLYTVYPKYTQAFGNNFDVANICSVADKFFSDALVEAGKLPDDNYEYLPEVGYRFGSIDKINPRIEVKIFPLD